MPKPTHVAFIMDGNRRYAKKALSHAFKGHNAGLDRMQDVVRWCIDKGISTGTFYTISTQNLKRAKEEFSYLMELASSFAKQTIQDIQSYIDDGIRFRFLGRLDLLPDELHADMLTVQEATKAGNVFTINLAVAYGGREEITDAVKHIARKVAAGELDVDDIDEDVLTEHMLLQQQPDMVIRTGGEHRTSNFFPWQTWYSEWFFLDCFWPEFSEADLDACIADFESRERRFGK